MGESHENMPGSYFITISLKRILFCKIIQILLHCDYARTFPLIKFFSLQQELVEKDVRFTRVTGKVFKT